MKYTRGPTTPAQHVAAVFDVARMSAAELAEINVSGVENVLRASKSYGAKRIVLTSRPNFRAGTSVSH
jgi:nucleoside-diphosphate-sugar epimerase